MKCKKIFFNFYKTNLSPRNTFPNPESHNSPSPKKQNFLHSAPINIENDLTLSPPSFDNPIGTQFEGSKTIQLRKERMLLLDNGASPDDELIREIEAEIRQIEASSSPSL